MCFVSAHNEFNYDGSTFYDGGGVSVGHCGGGGQKVSEKLKTNLRGMNSSSRKQQLKGNFFKNLHCENLLG